MGYEDLFKSLKAILRNVQTEGMNTHQMAFIAVIAVVVCAFFTLAIKRVARKSPRKHVKLGARPVHEIHKPKHLLREIHYAVSICRSEPAMLERCVALLNRYPDAVNIPVQADGFTPFLRACYNGCSELISYMLSNGADINSRSAKGDNAFYLVTDSILAGRCTTFAPLKELISAGVDINESRVGGYTALHLAAARGSGQVVRWLLCRGADPAPHTPAPPPYCLAEANGHLDTAALLVVNMDEVEANCG